jgi:hypothetical protein
MEISIIEKEIIQQTPVAQATGVLFLGGKSKYLQVMSPARAIAPNATERNMA